jgi:hypothetical protein
MPELYFTSVRQINKAIHEAALGGSGKQVRVVTKEGALPIIRARCDRDGFLHVRLVATGEEIVCGWDLVVA